VKTHPLNTFHSLSFSCCLAAAFAFAGLATHSSATTYYWNGTNGGSAPAAGWNLSTNWSANDDGTGAASIPGAADTAYLSITTATTGQTINLNASQSIAGLQIRAAQGAMTISSGTGTNTLTLGTSGITIGAGAGTTTLNAGIILNGNQAWANSGGTLLLNNSLSGTGNLAISGNFNATNGSAALTGVVTLTGQSDLNGAFLNGVSGGVVISTGTVGAQGASVTSDKAITFTGSTNWYTNGSNAFLSGSVSGGTMNNIGAGNLTLSGAADNAGLTVTTPGGTTYLAKTSSTAVHAVGTALSLAASSTTQITGSGGDQIKDTANVAVGTGATLDLNGNSETINNLTGSGGVTTTLAAFGSTLTVGSGNGSASFSGIVQNGSGTLALTKTGTGTQTLTGANTYTGATTVTGGTLALDFSVSSPASILSASSALQLGNSTFSVKGSATGTTAQTVNGLTLNPGAAAVSVNSNGGSGTSLSLGSITRNVGGTIDFTLPVSGNISTTTANANFSGGQQTILGGSATVGGTGWAVSGSGATPGAITALGSYNGSFVAAADVSAGTGTLTPAAMTINSLRFNNAGATTVNTGGNLIIATGGILETSTVAANAVTINNNTLTSGNGQDLIVIQNNTAGAMTIGSAIVNNGGTAIGLTKSGAGSLVLNGANAYTGASTINGPVTVNNTANLGSNSAVTLNGSGALTFTNNGAQLNLQAIGATATASTGTASGAIDGSMTSRWESASADPQWIRIDLKSVYNLGSASISWETAGGKNFVIQTGAVGASATPDGTNTNGWTTVSTTTNQASYSDKHFINYAFTPGASGQFVDVYGTARNTGYGYSIWEMQVFTAAGAVTQNIGSLSSTDSATSVSLGSQLTLSTGANNTSTTFAGAITGTGNLTKVGTGTQTLSGTNTYTGTTLVSGGKLIVNGSTSTGAVTVSNGATLGGTGTIGGATTIQSGGIHAPGNSPGIENFSSTLTYADGSIFAWDIDRTQTGRGTGYDAVNVTGAVAGLDGVDEGSSLNAIFRIVIGDNDFSNSFWSVDRSWTDIFTGEDGTTAKTDWAGIFGGGFQYYNSNGSALASAPTTGSFSLSGNTLSWTYSAVPEVSNVLAGVLLGAGLLRRKRRIS